MLKKRSVHFPHKMLFRLLASHILLVSIPLLATGYFLSRTTRTTIEDIILERNREIAVRSAKQIELTLDAVFEKLRLTADNPAIFDADYQSVTVDQIRTLQNLVREFPIFKEIALLDRSGALLYSTSFASERRANPRIELNDIQEQLLSGIAYYSNVYLNEETLPIMDVYEPVTSEFEDIVAFLWAKVDLKEIWDLVDNSKIGGEGAEAFIFRSDGQYIAHTDRREVLQAKYFFDQRIRDEVQRLRPASRIYQNRDGEEMTVAYAPITPTSWGFVIQQPTSEAFAVVKRMQLQTQLLLWISVALAALLAFFYSRNILRPVTRLVRGTKRIASGDLYYRIEPLGRDEISQLADHFNEMSANLRDYQNKLKRTERLETLGKLASVLSHEIRNPLNSMVINMQILNREFRRDQVDVKKLEYYYNVVVSEIKRVDELVSNFLLIARPPKLELEERRLSEVLDEVITTQMPLVLPRGIRIERRYNDETVGARIDVNKIKQVFLNILLNAMQAMPGGGKISVDVERINSYDTNQAVEMARIAFRDSGKGIKKEDLNHIFDFYYSTKPEGTGLGLSVALQIVEQHGGYIKVNSEAGKGTEVAIFLPVSKKVEHLPIS